MIHQLASLTVWIAGLYLVALGFAALVRPRPVRQFLSGFASSARVHYAELLLRLCVGAALVSVAPHMRYSQLFAGFGWVLIVTTVALLFIPWRVHHRFAQWSVPMATQRMPLFALSALSGGGFLLFALFR